METLLPLPSILPFPPIHATPAFGFSVRQPYARLASVLPDYAIDRVIYAQGKESIFQHRGFLLIGLLL